MDMTEAIAPRFDQINAEDLLSGPRTITVTAVNRGNDEQPVDIVTAEFGPNRAYRPSKTMRRILVAAWGKDSDTYTGRRMTIYRDPDVTFGKDKVGGIKISHLSDLDKRIDVALTVTRGRRAQFTVLPMPAQDTRPDAFSPSARTKWLTSLANLLTEGGVSDADGVQVVAVMANRTDLTALDGLTDAELRAVATELGGWKKAGELTDKVADQLVVAAQP